MINLWIKPRGSSLLHYPVYNRSDRMLKDGTINLSHITWYDRLLYELGDVRIGTDLLTQGYKI